MKWKCKNCVWGPCVFESPRNDDYLVNTEKCMQESRQANWQKMSGEEPEKEAETGLPEWLKVGNFVKFGGCNLVCRIEGYDTEQKILSISRKVWREDRTVKHDVHCRDGWGEAPVVFPKPYTFETAPLSMKVRRKADGKNDILRLGINHSTESFLSLSEFAVVSFYEALRDYEQLDGWPCGTFDGEDEK